MVPHRIRRITFPQHTTTPPTNRGCGGIARQLRLLDVHCAGTLVRVLGLEGHRVADPEVVERGADERGRVEEQVLVATCWRDEPEPTIRQSCDSSLHILWNYQWVNK